MTIKGIIFDLDGVICFTDRFHYQGWKYVADKYGIYFDEQINNRLRGVSRADSLEIILENYRGDALTSSQKQSMMDEKNAYYRNLLSTMTPDDISADVRETLSALHQKGYLIALGSSSKNARFILERTGLLQAFDAISDGNNITHSKPHPEVFLKAAEYLKLSPAQCMVVEDACAGIDAAKAGNMTAAGIGEAAGYSRSDFTLEKISDLLKIVP